MSPFRPRLFLSKTMKVYYILAYQVQHLVKIVYLPKSELECVVDMAFALLSSQQLAHRILNHLTFHCRRRAGVQEALGR